jgi:hypothetical protein
MADASRGIPEGDMDITRRTLRRVLENLLGTWSGADEQS